MSRTVTIILICIIGVAALGLAGGLFTTALAFVIIPSKGKRFAIRLTSSVPGSSKSLYVQRSTSSWKPTLLPSVAGAFRTSPGGGFTPPGGADTGSSAGFWMFWEPRSTSKVPPHLTPKFTGFLRANKKASSFVTEAGLSGSSQLVMLFPGTGTKWGHFRAAFLRDNGSAAWWSVDAKGILSFNSTTSAEIPDTAKYFKFETVGGPVPDVVAILTPTKRA